MMNTAQLTSAACGAILFSGIFITSAATETDSFDKEPDYSSLNLEYGQDSADAHSTSIGITLSDESAPQFLLVAGINESASDNLIISTNNYMAGLYSNSHSRWDIGLDYRYWGNTSEIHTHTYRATIGWRQDNYSLRVLPQYRKITLYLDPVILLARRVPASVETSSEGLAIEADYYGLYPFLLSAGYLKNNYEHDLSRLATGRLVPYLFSSHTLDLSSGLEQDRRYVDTGVVIKHYRVGLEWLESHSAVDNVAITATSAYFAMNISRHWSTTTRIGSQRDNFSGSAITFGAVNLNYHW